MKIPVSYQGCNCHVCGSSESVSLFDIRDELLVNEAGDELRFDLLYHHCPACGLVFCNPQLNESCWQTFYKGCRNGALLKEEAADVMARYIGSPIELIQDHVESGQSFLDLGCGAGDLLFFVRETCGAKVQGVELSEVLVPLALNRDIRVQQQDLMCVQFPDESQDWISLFHVLEHLPDPSAILKKVRSWLKPTGRLLIEVPSVFAPLQGVRNLFCSHNLMFSPANLVFLLRQSGFEIDLLNTDKHLLVIARLGEAHTQRPSSQEAMEPAEFLRRYQKQQQSELDQIDRTLSDQLSLWRKKQTPVLIWGAGEHTHKLMDRFSFEGVNLQGVIDSNQAAWGNAFRTLEIVAPNRLTNFSGDLLVSSHAYQKQIADQVRQINPKVGVVTLYRKEGA